LPAPEQPAPEAPVPKPEMRGNCPGLVATDRPPATPAAFKFAELKTDEVRLTFLGHSTFVIESPQLVRIVTDYNDYLRPPVMPDIVTMNHAHDTHYTDTPDPAIKYVLRGWGPSPSEPARHDLQYRDVRVRNVPTNIRDWGGGTERHGNSIFVFEIANLCIGHLGHLHQTLTQQQLDEIGRLDVVLAPVDGHFTLDLDGMIEVLTALNAPVIIPCISSIPIRSTGSSGGRRRSGRSRWRIFPASSSRRRRCRRVRRCWCCRGTEPRLSRP
jgi:Beta-lactamase superfamily domain